MNNAKKKIDVATFLNGEISMPYFDEYYADQARDRQKALTKPQKSLGKLEDISIWMAGWQRKSFPTVNNAHCLIFAGNHGIAQKGVSAYPSEVTSQMVENFYAGGAAINQLCNLADMALSVIPIDLENPTRDFSESLAMDKEETLSAMQIGFESVPSDCDLLVLGEMGIGNTSAATAIACVLFNQSVDTWTGVGSGLSTKGVESKISIIKSAHKLHGNNFERVEDILSSFSGREMAAIAGAVIAARIYSIPVLLDGFISTTSAATLTLYSKTILDHCLISHLSTEPGHAGILSFLGKEPLLDLNMRLGEGSGAAVASLIIRAALATHNGMATFSEAGVSGIK